MYANNVFWVPVFCAKVLGILRPLPNRYRNNKRFLDMVCVVELIFNCYIMTSEESLYMVGTHSTRKTSKKNARYYSRDYL